MGWCGTASKLFRLTEVVSVVVFGWKLLSTASFSHRQMGHPSGQRLRFGPGMSLTLYGTEDANLAPRIQRSHRSRALPSWAWCALGWLRALMGARMGLLSKRKQAHPVSQLSLTPSLALFWCRELKRPLDYLSIGRSNRHEGLYSTGKGPRRSQAISSVQLRTPNTGGGLHRRRGYVQKVSPA